MNVHSFCSGFVLIFLLTGGCSLGTLGKGQGSKSEPEVDETAKIEEHIVELERRATMVEVEVKRLRKRLAELESGEAATPRAAVDAPEMSSNRGALEPELGTHSRVPLPASDQAVEISDLPSEAAPSVVRPRAEAGGDRARSLAPAGLEDALTASAQALYDRGYTLFHQGRYVDSETAFQQFLQRFGSTVLGDNAQFWIAEARYARRDVSGALAAFRETVSRFPGGNKVPDAGLKIGDCLRDLGDVEGARRSYGELIETHPRSAAAAIAEERLAALR